MVLHTIIRSSQFTLGKQFGWRELIKDFNK